MHSLPARLTLLLIAAALAQGCQRVNPGWEDSDSETGSTTSGDSEATTGVPGTTGAPSTTSTTAGLTDATAGSGSDSSASSSTSVDPSTTTEDTTEPTTGAPPPIDSDDDDVIDDEDNCPLDPNPQQEDLDGDGEGDACDLDKDGDGLTVDCELVPDWDLDPDKPGVAAEDAVYINETDRLHRMKIAPPHARTQIGPFTVEGQPVLINDIAINSCGALVAVSKSFLYACNPLSASCWFVGGLEGINDPDGLGFAPATLLGGAEDEPDLLVATHGSELSLLTLEGDAVAAEQLAVLPDLYLSAGDIGALPDVGMLAPLKGAFPPDELVSFDPLDLGTITPLSDLEWHLFVGGLAATPERVFAFDLYGDIIVLEPQGDEYAATVVESDKQWLGAAARI